MTEGPWTPAQSQSGKDRGWGERGDGNTWLARADFRIWVSETPGGLRRRSGDCRRRAEGRAQAVTQIGVCTLREDRGDRTEVGP